MQAREERLFPYLSNFVLMLLSAYMIYLMRLPRVFFLLTLGAAAAVLIAVIINTKWKISIHMVGLGALIGTLFGLSSFLLIDLRMIIILFLIVAGLVGVARLTLGAHRPSQIYAGFLVGFLCEYLLLSI
jgi:membrane-associated phospholipid phosphatase